MQTDELTQHKQEWPNVSTPKTVFPGFHAGELSIFTLCPAKHHGSQEPNQMTEELPQHLKTESKVQKWVFGCGQS